MKEGWEVKKLSEISNINYGYTEKATTENIGPKFLRITDIQNNNVHWNSVPYCKIGKADLPKYQLVKGDIVFARTGATTGKSYLIKDAQEAVFASYLIRVKINNNLLLPSFLFQYFQTPKYWETILQGTSGSAQGGFNATKLGSLTIPIPPLSEQQRIVKILDKAFTAIKKAKENTEKNLQNSKELFDSYLNKVFANLGEDLKGKKLGKVCDFVRGPFGGSLKKQIFVEDGYAVFEQSHAIYNQFERIRYFINDDKFKEMSRFEVRPGNLIMSCSGTMGKVSIVPDRVKQGIINQALLLLKPNGSLFNKFLKYWIESDSFQESLKMYSQGAAIQNVASVKTLKEIQIHFPLLPVQKQIVAKLDSLSAETKCLESKYQQKLANLEELKKSILQKAFNGAL